MKRQDSILWRLLYCALITLVLAASLALPIGLQSAHADVYVQNCDFREMQPYEIELRPSSTTEFGVYDYVKEGITKLMVFSPEEMYGITVWGSLVAYQGNDKWACLYSGYQSDAIYDFKDIWGSSKSNTYLVNNNGLYLYNGTTLTPVSGVENPARVWGAASDDVYVARSDDGLYHYNGSAWSPVDYFSGRSVTCLGSLSVTDSVYGTVTNAVYAGAADGLHYFDGSAWTPVTPVPAAAGKAATCIGKTADGNLLVCYGKEVTCLDSGGQWTSLGQTPFAASKIAGTALDDLYGVLDGKLYLRKNDGNWYKIQRSDGSLLADTVYDFYVFARRDFLVAGLDDPIGGYYFNPPILYHGSVIPAPPPVNYDQEVTAYLRVEGYDKTIIPRTKITLQAFDLGKAYDNALGPARGIYLNPATGSSANEYSEGWGLDRFENGPTALHILLKALTDQGFSRHDPANPVDGPTEFDVQDYGWSLYVAMVGGDREFDRGSMSGWLYRINGWLPNYGSQAYNLEDGDEVVWYYSPTGFDTWYVNFEADREEVGPGETVHFTLTGETTDLSGASGAGGTVVQPIAGASILVNGQTYQAGGGPLITDAEGKAAITFDMAGAYEVNCDGWNIFGTDGAVRPASISITVSASVYDTTPPVFDSGYPQAEDVTTAGFNLKLKLNESGTAYYKMVTDGEASGNDYESWMSVIIPGAGEVVEAISGLTQGESYDVYVIVKDGAGNLQAGPVKLDVNAASAGGNINVQTSVDASGMVALEVDTEYPDAPVTLLVVSGSTRYYIDQFNTGADGKASAVFSLPPDNEYSAFAAVSGEKKEFTLSTASAPGDTTPPVITVTGLTDGMTAASETLNFTVSAVDDRDGEVTPLVKLGVTALTPEEGDSYTATLTEGSNIITVEATDDAGNIAQEDYTVTYTPAAEDTTPPVFASGYPQAEDVTATGFNLKFRMNESGTAYYKVVDDGATPGTEYESWTSVAIPGADEVVEAVSGLTPGQPYDMYVIAKDAAGNLQASPVKLDVTTLTEDAVISRVRAAIAKATNYVKAYQTYSSDWLVVGLRNAGEEIPSTYLNETAADIEYYFATYVNTKSEKVTDHERRVLGIVAAGGDPRNIGGHDLLERIYNFYIDANEAIGLYTPRDITFQGLNGPIYGLIALDSMRYTIPEDALYSRDYLIQYLLDNQNADGGWDLSSSGNSDVDITAMVLIGLAPYHDRADVMAAVNSGVAWLSQKQSGEGGYASWGAVNSESISQAVIALCANGADPTSEAFTKNGNNLLDALLTYQREDGAILHTVPATGDTGMSTEQGYQALLAYDKFVKNNGAYDGGRTSIYYFGEPGTSDATPPVIVTTGLTDGGNMTTAGLSFTAEAIDAVDGAVSVTVKLNGAEITSASGIYSVILADGDNTIQISAVDAAGNTATRTYTVKYTQQTRQASITGISPNHGPQSGGTTITISGSNLDTVTAVNFGDTAAAGFMLGTAASMPAVSPPGTGTVHVMVVSPSGSSTESDADLFTYNTPVTGTEITINNDGSNKHLEITTDTVNLGGAVNINVPGDVTDATVNVGTLLNDPAGGSIASDPLPAMNIFTATTLGEVQVEIPQGVTVSAPADADWDGAIHVPRVQANNTVTVTPDSGKTATVNTVIEVGFGDVPLTFDKAVRILVPGQAGKDAGYYRDGAFTKITTVLGSDSQAAGDALPAGGDGRIDVGQDLVIWTKHFTRFVTYTQTDTSSSSGGGGGGSGSVKVNIRVEGYNDTLVPRTTVSVDNFDLTPYLRPASGSSASASSGWGPDKLPKPTVAHALVRALQSNGLTFDLQDYGWSLYVAMIAGEREFDIRNTSGWLYRVNDTLPNIGCQEYTLKGGEDIVWYFAAYGFNTWYSKLTASKTSAATGEEITLTLAGSKTDMSGSGSGTSTGTKLKGATIYVNGAEYKPDGTTIVTDENGQAVIKFNNAGTYSVSGDRFNGEGYRDIVRPLPVKITVTGPSKSGSVPVKTSLTPRVEASNGVASVAISASDMTDAIKDAKENNSAAIVIAPEITGEARKVSVELPKSSLSSVASETDAGLTVETPVGSITIPNSALASIASQAAGGTVTVSLEAVDNSALTPEQREAVGDNPVYDISVISGGSSISGFGGGSLTISLPYALQEGEDPSGVTVWYLNDTGELEQVACAYDPVTGLAAFTTDHLSCYVVGYAEYVAAPVWTNPFSDLKPADWFYDSVAFAVRNGLFSGASATTFSPHEPMTRAMLVTVLYRLEGEPSVTGANGFTDVGSGEWYTDAVIWAHAEGIVAGCGGGLFGPDDNITREQMAGILYNYAKHKGYDVTAATDLAAYTDAAEISGWAQSAVKWANAGGLIAGTTPATLDPAGTATRAQVASILMRFVEGFAE